MAVSLTWPTENKDGKRDAQHLRLVSPAPGGHRVNTYRYQIDILPRLKTGDSYRV
ncbi:hypothetical protein BLA18109_01666 [Burkholderia lata]|uniref:Uncharacterized protein n=1 Tax=Burkholderia lata (strain ATCC 17760 / DSM 23089 / LMG 22485 / NCIMB 9086 / R18194 / 383) TaxID=482957 RepID=A0A6P2TM76_BURL3|nr:hypothetical protein BLA18109_01666 [Burkholderia lata]